MSDSDLWNCPSNLEFQCPQKWEKLATTGDENVRFCGACQKTVHLCKTAEEFVAQGNQGHCVAIPPESRPFIVSVGILGQPSPESVRKLEREQDVAREWWNKTLAQQPGFEPEKMARIAEIMKETEPRLLDRQTDAALKDQWESYAKFMESAALLEKKMMDERKKGKKK